tara:strand:- start:114 stop:578 length:465 start_codon:yes stop_codon:yes gene_type:complete
MFGFSTRANFSAISSRSARRRGSKGVRNSRSKKNRGRQASVVFSAGGTNYLKIEARPGVWGGDIGNHLKCIVYRSGAGGGIGRYSFRLFSRSGTLYDGTITQNGIIALADKINSNATLQSMVIATAINQTAANNIDFSGGADHGDATYLSGGGG